MAKKIKITARQLEEAMDVFVNKTATENPEQALRRTQRETEREIGTGKDINYVVSSDQIKESSQVYSKSQLLEARRKYLNETSNHYTKENFIKKN